MKIPLEYRRVPIAPSHSTGCCCKRLINNDEDMFPPKPAKLPSFKFQVDGVIAGGKWTGDHLSGKLPSRASNSHHAIPGTVESPPRLPGPPKRVTPDAQLRL